jgi:hypothetical protein
LSDFRAGGRCFVANMTPEGVGRDLTREAAGKLAKTVGSGQAARNPADPISRVWLFARYLPSLNELIDGVHAHFVTTGKGGDGHAARLFANLG